jgi:small-conductance mechanosensitive channel
MPAEPSPARGTASAATGYLAELLRALGVGAPLAQHLQDLLLRPLAIALVLLAAAVVAHVGSSLIRHAMARVRARTAARTDSEHPARRIDTVGRIVANVFRVTVWVVASLTVLSLVGIDLAPFLAGATVIGATIGFGAQSLVRDFLSGFLILVEDQYRIGDTVDLGDLEGVVEEVTLRVTRLRSSDGTTWYVPNGDIRRLGNESRQWARAVVDVSIPITIPLARAEAALEEAARRATSDPAIAPDCLEPPVVLGVVDASPTGLTLRVSVRTRPLADERVGRALRASIAERLVADGILPDSG